MLSLSETPAELCAAIAERIKTLRIRKGLRQQDVALKAAIPLPTYRLLERHGSASLENVVKVAQVLDASQGFEKLFETPEYMSIGEIVRRQHRSQRVRRAKT
jgi:transcriptional regulator with XRE-family HTH domain